MNERARWMQLAVAVLLSGLGLRAAFDGAIAKYGGVALWSTLVYVLLLVLWPRLTILRAFCICVAISFAVEFFQLTPVPRALYELHSAFALVFGTVFSWQDLPAYVGGAALGVILHATVRLRVSAPASS